jgi:hypothetical protein
MGNIERREIRYVLQKTINGKYREKRNQIRASENNKWDI